MNSGSSRVSPWASPLASSLALCCGVLRNWLAQGTAGFSSTFSSLFFSKPSKFLERDLALFRISLISRPAEPPDLGGGAPPDLGVDWPFFFTSLPFLPTGSVADDLGVPEVSCVLGERVGRGGTKDLGGGTDAGGGEVGGGGPPGRCWGMEEVGRGGGPPLTEGGEEG